MTYDHNVIDGEILELTPAEIAALEARDAAWMAAQPVALLKDVRDRRAAAYRAESDPLAIRAQRLAWLNDTGAAQAQADYLAKVADIKARFPYPA
jgi:hypothetical protein